MKQLLAIFLFISFLSVYGQEKKWSIETEINPAIKEKLVLSYELPDFVTIGPLSIEDYLNNFHPVHLNLDNQVDFIYYGFIGSESNGIQIFINQGGTLYLIENVLGRVDKISRKFPDSPIVIDFIQYGCCDDPLNFWQQWFIDPNIAKISIKKTEPYYFMKGTEFPKNFDVIAKFKIQNTPYNLRATPEIITDKPISHHFYNGNLISEYSSGDMGYCLSSSQDETGRVWWFVVMEEPLKEGYSVYSSYRSKKWLGWISSRYVELIQ